MKGNTTRRLYYFALTLYLLSKYIEVSTIYYTIEWINPILRIVRLSSYALALIFTIINLSSSEKVCIRQLVLLGVTAIISYIAKSVTFFFNFLFIFGARDIKNKQLTKRVLMLQVLVTSAIVIGSFCGIVPNWEYLIGDRYRQSLGFFYPNRISSMYFFMVLAYCYLRGKKISIVELAVLTIINFFIFHFTNTRMAFALTLVVLFVYLIIKIYKKPLKNNRLSRFVYLHSLYLIPLFAIVLCWMYTPSNSLLSKINDFVSNRLLMGHNALYKYPITLFGQKIEWVGFGGLGYIYNELPGEYNAVDCSYINILLSNGIIIMLIAIVGYILTAYCELKQGDRHFCVAILFMSIYCLIEPPYIESGFNPFVWTLSVLLTKGITIKRNKGGVYFGIRDIRPGRDNKEKNLNIMGVDYFEH